jgi:hypothetical protein
MTTIVPPTGVPLDNDGLDPATPPTMPYLHMWTGVDEASRLDLVAMTGFGMKSVGGKASPQWMRPFPGEVEAVTFAMLPVGWIGDWHETPLPQWVVPLRGRWFLETMDGTRVEMGPGDIHFGQDQGTRAKQGHRSGQLGDEPCFQLIVQFGKSPAAQTRNPFGI